MCIRDRTKSEFDSYKEHLERLETQIEENRNNANYNFQSEIKAALERQANELAKTFDADIVTAERTIKYLKDEVSERDRRLDTRQAEVEGLRNELNDKKSIIDKMNRRMLDSNQSKFKEIDELANNVENLRKANVEKMNLQADFATKLKAYAAQVDLLKSQNQSLEEQNGLLLNEVKRLRGVTEKQLGDLLNDKEKHQSAEEGLNEEIHRLREELNRVGQNRSREEEMLLRFASEKANYEAQISQLKSMNDNLKSEIEKMFELLYQRRNELDSVTQENTKLREEAMNSKTKTEHLQGALDEENSKRTLTERRLEQFTRDYKNLQRDKEIEAEEFKNARNEMGDALEKLAGLREKYNESIKKAIDMTIDDVEKMRQTLNMKYYSFSWLTN
eukprot:TRINITY_DN1038_c0_g1_i15.p1 TRINITY_DN1038_c0_g1~~TRINITY_DN1038_c0_g1_i15.p1  ORF type:complete len:389 (-),score=118.75 TRINITY_DN1038_c0_g1_i15:84-1250(-)